MDHIPLSKVGLGLCPDCEKPVSRGAESCPNCGRFFQHLRNNAVIVSGTVSVDRTGWTGTVAGGIVLAWVLVGILSIVAAVFLFFLMIGAMAPAAQNINR